MKIKKEYNLKILAIVLIILLILDNMAQAIEVYTKTCLRVPLMTSGQLRQNNNYSKVEGVQEDEYLFLQKINEPLPQDTYLINERYLGAVRYSKEKRHYMLTRGLKNCAAIIFYDPVTKTSLMSHSRLDPGTNIGLYVLFLLNNFLSEGGSLENLEITIVWGNHDREERLPVMAGLISILKKINHKKFRLDSTKNTDIRAVCLNIENGEINEIKGPPNWWWKWHNEYDTSLNILYIDQEDTKLDVDKITEPLISI